MPHADVFISYRRDQREQVTLIAEKLQDLGLSVWFDARLEAGTSFDEEINREVRTASAVLVCWTPEAIQSRWVRAEASIGLERDVLVAALLAPTELITPYNLIHTEDLQGWAGEQDSKPWRGILDRIGSLVGRPNLSEEAAAKSLDSEWIEKDRTDRADFKAKVDEARRRFAALHQSLPTTFEQSLRDMIAAFESWILRRRLGKGGSPPDPLSLVDDQTEALRLDLATAKRERDAVANAASRIRNPLGAAKNNAPKPLTPMGIAARFLSVLVLGPIAMAFWRMRWPVALYFAALCSVVAYAALGPSQSPFMEGVAYYTSDQSVCYESAVGQWRASVSDAGVAAAPVFATRELASQGDANGTTPAAPVSVTPAERAEETCEYRRGRGDHAEGQLALRSNYLWANVCYSNLRGRWFDHHYDATRSDVPGSATSDEIISVLNARAAAEAAQQTGNVVAAMPVYHASLYSCEYEGGWSSVDSVYGPDQYERARSEARTSTWLMVAAIIPALNALFAVLILLAGLGQGAMSKRRAS